MNSKINDLAPEIKNSFLSAINNASIVSVTDIRGNIIFANELFCKYSEYSLDELIGKNHRIINSGEHPKKYFNDLWKTISTGTTWRGEIKNKAKGGTYYWVDTVISPVMDNKGEIIQFLSIRNLITDKKVAEKNLDEALERFKFATLATNDIICDWVINDNTLWWNKNYYTLMNIKKGKELLDLSSWKNFIYPNDHDRVMKSFSLFLESDETYWEGEYRFQNTEGKVFNLFSRGYLIRDENGKPMRMIGAISDITERIRNENEKLKLREQLIISQESERNRIAQDLHDGILQMLAASNMQIHALKETCNNHNEGLIYLNVLGTLVVDSLKEVRDISHNLSCKAIQLGLDVGIRKTIEAVNSSCKISLESTIAEKRFSEKVEINIYRVLQEIINNTLKHAQANELTITMEYDQNNLIITTKDDGIGFFLNEVNQKTGLGLTSLKNRIEMISGNLKINSSSGNGTEYIIKVENLEVLKVASQNSF